MGRRHSVKTRRARQGQEDISQPHSRRCSSVRVPRTSNPRVSKENSLPATDFPGGKSPHRELPAISISNKLDTSHQTPSQPFHSTLYQEHEVSLSHTTPSSPGRTIPGLDCAPAPASPCHTIPTLAMPGQDDEDDQFAEYLYQSRHIATPRSSPPPPNTPHLVFEVPSDTESSRRPSQYSQLSISPSPSSFISPSPSCGFSQGLSLPKERRRRASHGELSSSPSDNSPSPFPIQDLLGVPVSRPRGASLPGTIDPAELYRLRNFSLQGKKVINRGDSYKSRSRTSINSRRSSLEMSGESSEQLSYRSGRSSLYSSRRNSRSDSRLAEQQTGVNNPGSQSRNSSCVPGDLEFCQEVEIVRVLLLGGPQVGKSSLCAQFLSSEHINAYDRVEDTVCKEVSVAVNKEEKRLVFVDHQHGDMSIENQLTSYCPDAFLVVLAVDDSSSLDQAENILSYLARAGVLDKPTILVANKADLVRNRVVKTAVGKSLAQKYNIKYIETSPGINHNIDELLVGITTQLKLRTGARSEQKQNKILDFFGRVLNLQPDKNKSCSNLNIL